MKFCEWETTKCSFNSPRACLLSNLAPNLLTSGFEWLPFPGTRRPTFEIKIVYPKRFRNLSVFFVLHSKPILKQKKLFRIDVSNVFLTFLFRIRLRMKLEPGSSGAGTLTTLSTVPRGPPHFKSHSCNIFCRLW